MTENLRLAVVADIHHGPTRYTKKGARALPLLRAFADTISTSGFDLVVDLGDRISNVDHDADLTLMRDVADVFDGVGAPRAHLLGNHDLHHLSIADNEDIFGRPFASHSIDAKGRHLVFWQHDLSGKFAERPLPSQADLDWLREDLAGTSLPAVVFTHVPLSDGAMTGNFYFQNNAPSGTLPRTHEARAVIEAAGNVVLCVAGHVHWNDTATIDGIRYLTLQSLTESYTTQDEAAGAWAEIEVGDQVTWRAHGGDPLLYEAPLRGRNMRWAQPLPPFPVLRQRERIADLDRPVRGVILDMDGVLYRGAEPIDGSAEAVRALRKAGLHVVCLTNNARGSPGAYAQKLAGLGIEIEPTDIVTSGMALAHYLSGQSAAPKVHIVGSAALRRTLLDAGALESDDPDYVVAGIELGMTVADLVPAVRHIANGARLVASNRDAVIPTPDGPEPEAGAVVAFLEAATGQEAAVLGKPHPAIFDLALERLGIAPDETIVVGDTPATDIAGATAAGLRAILVASGNAPADAPSDPEPTARFADLRSATDFLLRQQAS